MFEAFKNLETPPIPPFVELPDTYSGLRTFIRDLYLSHDSVARIAYKLWLDDGQPDGEQPCVRIDVDYGMKVREMHWWQATMMLDVVADTDISFIFHCVEEWRRQQGLPSLK